MKLVDLDPRWILRDGKRIGFVFRSPTRGHENWWSSCYEVPPSRLDHTKLAEAATRGERAIVQGCNSDARWTIAGGIENADFETMTVTPSLDGSAADNWHGHITNGQIVGGL